MANIDWWDEFIPTTPEEIEAEERHRENLRIKMIKKVENAVKAENIEFSQREGWKRPHKEKGTSMRNTLFICTKEGIYDARDTLGKMEFTVYENVSLQDVYVMASRMGKTIEGEMEKLLHVDIVAIFERYRGYGLSEKLLDAFIDIVEERYRDIPMSIEFKNPIAEYSFRKVLKKRGMEGLLNEPLVHRYYDEEQLLLNAMREKDASFAMYECNRKSL